MRGQGSAAPWLRRAGPARAIRWLRRGPSSSVYPQLICSLLSPTGPESVVLRSPRSASPAPAVLVSQSGHRRAAAQPPGQGSVRRVRPLPCWGPGGGIGPSPCSRIKRRFAPLFLDGLPDGRARISEADPSTVVLVFHVLHLSAPGPLNDVWPTSHAIRADSSRGNRRSGRRWAPRPGCGPGHPYLYWNRGNGARSTWQRELR